MIWLTPVTLAFAAFVASEEKGHIPGPDYAGTCTDVGCHAALVKRPVVHDPAAQGSCDLCHESTDKAKHQFKLTAQGAELCTNCHDAPAGKVKHDPVVQGACTTCHDPHGSTGKHLLTRDTVGQVCAECHAEVTEKPRYLHGPAAAGACTTCHRPHAGDHAKLLSGPEQELCLKCHDAVKERLAGKAHRHAPVEGNCTGCHNPHGAGDKMMLASAPPELCFSCHDELATLVKEAAVRHAPATQGSACANCHEAHGSEFAALLRQDPLVVCVSCHNRVMETPSGKLEDFKKLLADNPQHHGPVADKDCTACHREVHGGKHFRLLADEYPAAFYASYDEKKYALCFGCHEAKAFGDERTTTGTEFRNGHQNLHHLHVNRTVKGRTCRACHQPHASKQAKFIADSVPFGGWEIPIRFEKTTTGGSCLPGCHREYRYDRQTAVANVPATPASGTAATTRPSSR